MTDLSKAFDCLPHTLLIAELNAYGFRLKALKLMNNSQGNQRTKTNKLIVPDSKFFLECLKVRW